MTNYLNKYRNESVRLAGWNYSFPGCYFLTLVIQHRAPVLGEIKDGKMILSDFGKIVNREWLRSFEIRKELKLEEYVLMPDHLHGLVLLENPRVGSDGRFQVGSGGRFRVGADGRFRVGADGRFRVGADGRFRVGADGRPPQPEKFLFPPQFAFNFFREYYRYRARHGISGRNNIFNEKPTFQRMPRSISSFVAGFKAAVNARIDDYIDENGLEIPKYNRQNHFFQPNYHDQIIRNITHYFHVKNYIRMNPIKWEVKRIQIVSGRKCFIP